MLGLAGISWRIIKDNEKTREQGRLEVDTFMVATWKGNQCDLHTSQDNLRDYVEERLESRGKPLSRKMSGKKATLG
jgi:hypothetical protein